VGNLGAEKKTGGAAGGLGHEEICRKLYKTEVRRKRFRHKKKRELTTGLKTPKAGQRRFDINPGKNGALVGKEETKWFVGDAKANNGQGPHERGVVEVLGEARRSLKLGSEGPNLHPL